MKAAVKEIVFGECARTPARVAGLLAGQGDVINNVPVEELSRFDKHPKVRAEKVEGQRMYFLAMNVTHKPFDNKLVRQAINYAVDPTTIIKHIYEGNGYVMNGPMGSKVIGFDPKIKRYPVDLKKAKELLDKAGYPNGLEVKLYFSPDRYPKAKEVCQVIADQLGQDRHQGRTGIAGVRGLLGQESGSTAASRPFIMSAGRPPTPTPSMINTIAPALARAFNTKIPSSIKLLTRSSAPAMLRSASLYSIKRGGY